jgi:tetratricopeptide (TPR) repeat protein
MKKLIIIIVAGMMVVAGCTKDYLEKRSDQSLLVPTTPDDFQKLLDAPFQSFLGTYTGLNEISCDNFTANDATLLSLDAIERNAYLWEKDMYQGASVNDWNMPYRAVFTCNVVLEGLNQQAGNVDFKSGKIVKGSALYYRAVAFYTLAQQFAVPYNKTTASSVPGIPIRTSADVNIISKRGTLEETYQRVLTDLKEAATLLPANVSIKNRPTSTAAIAMLARTLQTMGEYEQALQYASAALSDYSRLIDYNTLEPSGYDSPFPLILPNGNDEAICYGGLVGYSFFIEPGVLVSPELYGSYEDNDLRKSRFFADQGNGGFNYVGSYTGDFSSLFAGPATDELFLIRAECNARAGNTIAALNDLNDLLVTRWRSGTYVPRQASSAAGALALVLIERRKELIGRGLRWTDLRRLNQDTKFAITLERTSGGTTFKLVPDDKRYTFVIPDEEISRSGIQQNER